MERNSAAGTEDEALNPYAAPSPKSKPRKSEAEEVNRPEPNNETDYFWIIWGVGVGMASLAITFLLIWSTGLLR